MLLGTCRRRSASIIDPGSVCSIEVTGLIHRVDSNLLLGDSEPLAIRRERANAYWQGEVSDRPAMETLFVGDALIVDTAL